MKKVVKWGLIGLGVIMFIGAVSPKQPQDNQKQLTEVVEVKKEAATSTPVPTIQPFNIEVTSQIVKKVNGKYRYFFDIRNKDNRPFEGDVKISIYKSNPNSKLGGDTFSTNKPIEPNLGNSVYTDANTGPVSEMGTNGMTDYKYEVLINKQVVKTGEGKIIDKFENLQ